MDSFFALVFDKQLLSVGNDEGGEDEAYGGSSLQYSPAARMDTTPHGASLRAQYYGTGPSQVDSTIPFVPYPPVVSGYSNASYYGQFPSYSSGVFNPYSRVPRGYYAGGDPYSSSDPTYAYQGSAATAGLESTSARHYRSTHDFTSQHQFHMPHASAHHPTPTNTAAAGASKTDDDIPAAPVSESTETRQSSEVQKFLEAVQRALGDELYGIFVGELASLKALVQKNKTSFAQKVRTIFISVFYQILQCFQTVSRDVEN